MSKFVIRMELTALGSAVMGIMFSAIAGVIAYGLNFFNLAIPVKGVAFMAGGLGAIFGLMHGLKKLENEDSQ